MAEHWSLTSDMLVRVQLSLPLKKDINMWYDRIENYIKLEDCKDQGLYVISARNFNLGIYSEKDKGFFGIRTKFNLKFIDIEFHWDSGKKGLFDANVGTVKPLEFLEIFEIPINIKNMYHYNDDILDYLNKKQDEYQINGEYIRKFL